jgi:hypothetical protein
MNQKYYDQFKKRFPEIHLLISSEPVGNPPSPKGKGLAGKLI